MFYIAIITFLMGYRVMKKMCVKIMQYSFKALFLQIVQSQYVIHRHQTSQKCYFYRKITPTISV